MKYIEIQNEFDNNEKLIIIESIISNKQKYLLNCHKDIKYKIKDNEFLDKVRNDYEQYYEPNCQQKIDQIKALQLLNWYIEEIKGELSEMNNIDALEEQNKILDEIKKIRQSLLEIIDDTKILKHKFENNSFDK